MPGINHLLDDLMLRAANGPLHRFSFTPERSMRGSDVEKLLREHGIPIFDRRREAEGDLSFGVRRSQAPWAEFLLCRARVRLNTPLLDPELAELFEEEEPQQRTLVGRLLDALLRIAD